VQNKADLEHIVKSIIQPGDLVLTVGAGDITKLSDVLFGGK
jgi:UDP-N-acetylmuramate-alanine ligase